MEKPKIVMIGEGTVSDDIRLNMTGGILEKRGYPMVREFQKKADGSVIIPEDFDMVIMARPHSPDILAEFKKRGVKVVVDLDDDFWSIPKGHPGYMGVGPGNPKGLKLIEECLSMADMITTPSEVLRDVLRRFNPTSPIEIVPNGWSATNPLWHLKRHRMAGNWLNIGWAGTITHREDFQVCYPALRKTLREHSNTRIIIGQDDQIYNMFKDLPEERKLFLPPLPYNLYPLMLSYIDIWLAPLVNNRFNASKSDIKLVDAGAASKPWIASNLPAYVAWDKGGYLCSNHDDWCDAFGIMMDPVNRGIFADSGHYWALKREQEFIVEIWEKIIGDLMK